MRARDVRWATTLAALLGATLAGGQEPTDPTAREVWAREVAFARTMADRDLDAFASFVSEEAIFLGRGALRGRGAVVEGWTGYFEGAEAPFSWAPQRVEVVASGDLAISTGPVRDPGGERIGTYNSTWRRDPDGQWRVVLDNGCPPCPCPPPRE